MEEANMCGINHLDADARLPPRKRLLAGLKKQNCDYPSSSLPLNSISSDINIRLRDLLGTNNKASNLSPEEIVDASKSAALAAAKVAAAARAAAEEKAAVAAKAVAAAKSALELVASFSVKRSRKERCLRKNKPKKQVQVKHLYKKRKLVENRETDEELARKLHRVINSSPRITRNCSSSDPKVHNHKKHRQQLFLENKSNGGVLLEGNPPSTCDMNAEADDIERGENMVKLDEKPSEFTKTDCSKMDSFHANGEAEASHSKVQVLEDTVSPGRKRGRIKQKKLSLSLCTIRDRENRKEEPESRVFQSVEEPKAKCSSTNVPLSPVEPSTESEVSHEGVSPWKFNAPQCYSGSNILRSICSNPTVTTGSAMIEVDQ